MLTFPLSVSDFQDQFSVADVNFMLNQQQEISGMGNGSLLVADVGPAYWSASVTTLRLAPSAASKVLVLIDSLGGGLRPFNLYNPRACYPSSDVDGALLTGFGPTVSAVPNSNSLSIDNLPPGFVITIGDMFTVIYGSPERVYLGRFVGSAAADGTGTLAALPVAPPLPAGVVASDNVLLSKPYAKFKMVPNSVKHILAAGKFTKITFTARQTHEAG